MFWVELNFYVFLKFYNFILYVLVGNLCVMIGDRYFVIMRLLKYGFLMICLKVLVMIFVVWIIFIGILFVLLLW